MTNFLKDVKVAPPVSGVAVPNPGLKQIDGNQSTLGLPPTKAPPKPQTASPMHGRSGMEQAMGALADKEHPSGRRFHTRTPKP